MREIHITDDVVIYNDIPGFLSKNQPRWHRKVYHMWRDTWRRIYSNIHWFGSLIEPSFQYLSNYVKWIEDQPRFNEFCNTCNKTSWSVDKDTKYPGNKNYYPEYMTLMLKSENALDRINRNGTLNSKQPLLGLSLDNTNKIILAKSTLDVTKYGFDRRNVNKSLNKKYKSHKGYKWLKVNYKHNKKYRIKMTI